MTPQDLHKTLTKFFEVMGLAVTPEVTQDGDFFCVNLTGKDVRLLERGQENKAGALITIWKILLKREYGQEPRLVVDFNNQRKEKLQNVVQLAKKKAEMVRISGNEEEMPPMTPAERRAVHVALREMTGVKTESRGVEPHRRIVITLDYDSSES